MKRSELRVRDPYILLADGTYYLYRANVCHVGTEIVVHKSDDLEEWSDTPVTVYSLDRSTWKEAQLWAPEVHAWNGKYYLFVSVLGKNGLRGTEISVADTPCGPFLPQTDRPATPLDQSAIDGTLYVEEGVPYIVYSRDWPHCFDEQLQSYVGELWACELTQTLDAPAGEPFCLFRSTECPISAAAPARNRWEGKHVTRYGSDAPFLMHLPGGRIYLTWSPIPNNNYVILGAHARSIRGEWTHSPVPLFDKNGGHAMFFTDKEGVLRMLFHCPEAEGEERATLIPVTLTEDAILPIRAQ